MAGRYPDQNRRTGAKKNSMPRRRGTGVIGRLLAMLMIVAVFVLGVAIFFKVNSIEVQGNSMYSAQEVIDASGIVQGDNLMLLNKAVAAGKIMAALPYIESVQIGRSLPDKVVIAVRESDAAFAVTDANAAEWLINTAGKVLEQAPDSAADYPKITGITAENPKTGSMVQCEQTDRLDAALAVLTQLETTGYIGKIVEVDVEKTYDITIWYQDQYEIRLGGTDDLEYKMRYLSAVLDQLEDYQTGVIDLTFEEDKAARFQPW